MVHPRPYRLAFLFTILVLTPSGSFPQRMGVPTAPGGYQIHGQVRYLDGGSPAESVLVKLESFNGGNIAQILTDRTGKFQFSGLGPDQYIILAHLSGYRDVRQEVNLQTSASEYLFLQLRKQKDREAAQAAGSGTLVLESAVPQAAQAEYNAGRLLLLDRKDAEDGIPRLEKAISIYSNYLAAQFLLGVAYMELHRWDRAESALARAVEIDPKAANAFFALGETYMREKKFPQSEKALRDGLKLDDKSWQGHFNLGRVYWAKNDFVKAGPEVGKTILLKPDFPDAHLLAGNILLRARKPIDALDQFREYLRLAPNGEFAAQAKATTEKIQKALAER